MHQNSKRINQYSTLRWNKMSTQQQDLQWNAGAAEVQQLNPGGPPGVGPTKDRSSSPNQLNWKFLGRSHHYVWGFKF